MSEVTEIRVLDNEILKNAFTDALASRAECQDLNEDMCSGIYTLYNPQNSPMSPLYGVLLHMKYSADIIAQFVLPNSGNAIFRIHWGNQGWYNWRQLGTTVLT